MFQVPETRTNTYGFMGMNHRLYTAAEHGPQGELCIHHLLFHHHENPYPLCKYSGLDPL